MLRQTLRGCFFQEVGLLRRAMSKSKKGKGNLKTEHTADQVGRIFPVVFYVSVFVFRKKTTFLYR